MEGEQKEGGRVLCNYFSESKYSLLEVGGRPWELRKCTRLSKLMEAARAMRPLIRGYKAIQNC